MNNFGWTDYNLNEYYGNSFHHIIHNKLKSPLHVLHLEDDANDAALVQATLETEGIACAITYVRTRDSFVSALERGGIDLILSDFALPAFDGLSAAEIVRARWSVIPLILISGSLGEDLAINSFKSGATDWVPKKDLSRLGPAVRRAMREVEERAERRHLEAQIIEAQKMEVISQLSSGVAHDFNNILAVIIGYSELITDISPDGRVRKYAEEIRLASNRAAGLTRQLLVFSRKQLVQLKVIDPNDAVKDLEILLRRLIDQKIEIAVVRGQSGHVKADAGHIGQVLLNLALNARDAMPNGGKLSIEANAVTLDKTYTHKHSGINPGDYVMLRVSDTGTGMTEEVKAHLFEAFFTTKPLGTGLGLVTSRTIVQQFGGHIDVHSELGKGTTFKIYLPRVEQALDLVANPAQKGPFLRAPEDSQVLGDRPLMPNGCVHRILVVDDDISVRQLTTQMLIRFGYQVDAAEDGAAGWEALLAKRYDLLITDNSMPKVTGIEMVKKLHAAHMDMPIIMATAVLPQEEFILHPWLQAVPTLLKPFRGAELLSAVRKALSVRDSAREQIPPPN
jgi:two-component system cell cycle sensor histidine kinase/response regulator CckA